MGVYTTENEIQLSNKTLHLVVYFEASQLHTEEDDGRVSNSIHSLKHHRYVACVVLFITTDFICCTLFDEIWRFVFHRNHVFLPNTMFRYAHLLSQYSVNWVQYFMCSYLILCSDMHFYWINIRLIEYNILSVQA